MQFFRFTESRLIRIAIRSLWHYVFYLSLRFNFTFLSWHSCDRFSEGESMSSEEAIIVANTFNFFLLNDVEKATLYNIVGDSIVLWPTFASHIFSGVLCDYPCFLVQTRLHSRFSYLNVWLIMLAGK